MKNCGEKQKKKEELLIQIKSKYLITHKTFFFTVTDIERSVNPIYSQK